MNRWGLLIVCSAALAGCPSQQFKNVEVKNFGEVLHRYERLEPVRSLAVAVDAQGNWTYGVVEAELTDSRANDKALGACQKSVDERGLQAECKPYALGPDVVWSGPKPR